jgi:hypothetical protein
MAVCHLPETVAKTEVADGRAVRSMPVTEQAYRAGDIGRCQMGALRRARRGCEETFAIDEKALVEEARELRYSHFRRSLGRWCVRNKPEVAEDEYASARDDRRLHLSQSFGGIWFLDGQGDPITGAIVEAEIERLEQQLFEADWAAAKARLGRDPLLDELGRTPQQRRWDAEVEMAIRSASTAPDARRPEPLFVVHVGEHPFADMLHELVDGTVLPPGALLPWAVEGWIERIVHDGPSRVIDVGVRRRIFDGATREAIIATQRECAHPYCEQRAEHCQVDHIEPWSEGGLTVQDNGRPLCGYHNRLRNRRSRPPPD